MKKQKRTGNRKTAYALMGAMLLAMPSATSAFGASTQPPLASVQQANQSKNTISGTVVDKKTGEPIIGAAIKLKGTTTGTVTNADGRFTIQAKQGDQLEISYISYTTLQVTASNGMKVEMSDNTESLDEVVVVGYGTQKKSDVTGSLVTVNTKDLMRKSPISIAQGLQGAAAGVIVTQDGSPDGSLGIRIRGVATMKGNTNPLWVVDGVQQGNSASLDWLDPSDVENIEILKDASAAAIYGTRGANGVILVTTKKGATGKAQVDVKADFGISTAAHKYDVCDVREYAKYVREAYGNDAENIFEAMNGNYDDQLNNIDWQDVMTHTAIRQQYKLGISGGTDNFKGNASVSYLNNQGVVIESWYKRLTVRLGAEADLFKNHLKLGFTTNFNTAKRDVNGRPNMKSIAKTYPTMDYAENGVLTHVPVVYPDGTFGHFEFDQNSYYGPRNVHNVYADRKYRRFQRDYDNDNGNIRNTFFIDLQILKGLTFHSNMNYNYYGSNGWNYTPSYIDTFDAWRTAYVDPTTGEHYVHDQFSTNGSGSSDMGIENYLTYDNTFGKVHHLTVMVGQSASRYHGSSNGSSTQDLTFSDLRGFYSSDPNLYNNGSGGPNMQVRYASYFGRLNYSYADRYLFTATVRRDGSSKFGSGNKWGTFPSLAVAWRAGEEKFIKDLGIFSNLKVRFGWGKTGNSESVNATDAIPQYAVSGKSFDFINPGGGANNFSRLQGIAKAREIDPNLKWEANEQFNWGLDLGFLNGDLNVTLDYFIRNTNDLIVDKVIRPSAGFGDNSGNGAKIVTNFGKIRNQGFEFNITYNHQFNQDWSMNVGVNGTTNKNKAIDVGDETYYSNGWTNSQICKNGLALGSYYGYRVDHIAQNQEEIDALNQKAQEKFGAGVYYYDKNTQPGDFIFKDLNGDGHITDADKEVLGNGFPSLTYGINLGASYKNWDFSAYLYGVFGQHILSGAKKDLYSGYASNLLKDYVEDHWTVDNPGSKNPRASAHDYSKDMSVLSDYFIENGNYLKLSNLQIGYTFNIAALKQYIRSARVYVSGQNLFTISPYNKYGDPEVNGGVTSMGYDSGRYPSPRTFMCGLQVTF